jgi:hypothetical protein
VTFNNPSWYTPDFLSTAASGMSGGGGIGAGAAMMDAKERAWDLSNVCIGAISPGARQTTHQSDTTGRWLAAQEVFNIIQQKKLWTSYGAAVGGLRFMLDGKIYSGFKVTMLMDGLKHGL